MAHLPGFVAAAFLLSLVPAGALLAEGPSAGPGAGSGMILPHPDLLEAYVAASGPPAGVGGSSGVAGAVEGAREIKRPGRSASSPVPAGDRRVVPRRGGAGAAWRFQYMLPLLAVLGLILAAALVVKRFLPGRRLLTGSGVLEIVARTPLSARQSLVLVKMGRRLVLLGVCSERVSALSVVDDPEQVAMLLGEIASTHPESMTRAFARSFSEQAVAYQEDPSDQDAAAAARGHVRGLLAKVRQFARAREVA